MTVAEVTVPRYRRVADIGLVEFRREECVGLTEKRGFQNLRTDGGDLTAVAVPLEIPPVLDFASIRSVFAGSVGPILMVLAVALFRLWNSAPKSRGASGRSLWEKGGGRPSRRSTSCASASR